MEYKKNDRVTLTIEDMGSDGEGIGKVDGFTLFIKDAVIGDQVEAKIIKSKKHYAYARLEKVLQPSPFRVEPKCAYHRQCGGCQLQALSYSEQLHFKEQKIRNNLIRIGGFDAEYIDERMQPIVGMEEPFHYRNKAQYPIGTDRDGNVITGFYAGRTHTIIANTDCALGASENQQILETILSYMHKNKVTAYDEVTGKGLVRHVLIRKGFTSGQLMVCLVINKKMTKMSYPTAGVQKNTNEFLPNQEELLAAVNEARCTWGELWFDKIIVAAPGTTAFCIAQTLREEWADTEKLTVICQNTLKDLRGPVEADEILLAEKDSKKIEQILQQADNTLILGSSSESSVLLREGKKFWCCNIAYPVQDEVLLATAPFAGIRGAGHMLQRLWNLKIKTQLPY